MTGLLSVHSVEVIIDSRVTSQMSYVKGTIAAGNITIGLQKHDAHLVDRGQIDE
jgi:hypothetical protein